MNKFSSMFGQVLQVFSKKDFYSAVKDTGAEKGQRGTNDNTNGLLRQYFPKGVDFRNISDKEIAIAVKKINNRSGKCLSYRTPHEVYFQALRSGDAL